MDGVIETLESLTIALNQIYTRYMTDGIRGAKHAIENINNQSEDQNIFWDDLVKLQHLERSLSIAGSLARELKEKISENIIKKPVKGTLEDKT